MLVVNKKPRKKLRLVFGVVGILVVVLVAGVAGWMGSPLADDFGTLGQLREDFVGAMEAQGASIRPVSQRFSAYEIGLNPLMALLFKTGRLQLFMRSWEGSRLETASMSQFEIGPGSGKYFDFTFMVRAKPEWPAPIFHGDALLALPGVSGALYMDFYDPTGTVNLPDFFGNRADRLKEVRAKLDEWWNRENFGKLTPHLDAWKSPWRLEIHEPKNATAPQRKAYFAAVSDAYHSYLAVYIESLEALTTRLDSRAAAKSQLGVRSFVKTLYDKDIAVAMGRMLFPEADFEAYLLDGFWGTGSLGIK